MSLTNISDRPRAELLASSAIAIFTFFRLPSSLLKWCVSDKLGRFRSPSNQVRSSGGDQPEERTASCWENDFLQVTLSSSRRPSSSTITLAYIMRAEQRHTSRATSERLQSHQKQHPSGTLRRNTRPGMERSTKKTLGSTPAASRASALHQLNLPDRAKLTSGLSRVLVPKNLTRTRPLRPTGQRLLVVYARPDLPPARDGE